MNYKQLQPFIRALQGAVNPELGVSTDDCPLLQTLALFVIAGELMAINENLPMTGRGN